MIKIIHNIYGIGMDVEDVNEFKVEKDEKRYKGYRS